MAPKKMAWAELAAKFAPGSDAKAKLALRAIRLGAFVGLAQGSDPSKPPHNFVLFNPDRSAKFEWVVKRDPSFGTRLLEVYRVDSVVWEDAVKELVVSPAAPN